MRANVFLCMLGMAVATNHPYEWEPVGGKGSSHEQNQDPEHLCLVDAASCSCCLMQKQLNKLEGHFNRSLDALEHELQETQTALDNFRAHRAAFSVALRDHRWCMGPYRDDSIIDYKHVFLNHGNGFDVATGKFTVPISGVYSVAITVYSDAGMAGNSLKACANLLVNGRVVAARNDNNMQDQEDSATVVLALQLNRGEEMYVTLPTGCFLCDNNSHFNTFSGFLLFPQEQVP